MEKCAKVPGSMMAARVFEPENKKIADENAMIKLSGSSRRTRAQGQARGFAGQYLIDALRGSIEAGPPTRGQARHRPTGGNRRRSGRHSRRDVPQP